MPFTTQREHAIVNSLNLLAAWLLLTKPGQAREMKPSSPLLSTEPDMRDFFKGWERKSGCVTLVMACVFMAGWVRSFVANDVIDLKEHLTFASINSCMVLVVPEKLGSLTESDWEPYWEIQPASAPGELESELVTFFTWRFRWFGFGFGDSKNRDDSVCVFVVPYWSVVLPLPLLSTCLLLRRLRPANISSDPVPQPVEGA